MCVWGGGDDTFLFHFNTVSTPEAVYEAVYESVFHLLFDLYVITLYKKLFLTSDGESSFPFLITFC